MIQTNVVGSDEEYMRRKVMQMEVYGKRRGSLSNEEVENICVE